MFNFLIKDDIGEPPWDYYFLQNLPESEYPKYLAKLFELNTGENLPLKYDFKTNTYVINKKKCKTFNQKIQYIKLYGITDLICNCTNKIKVRNYVKEKIGEEYLKPVLQICDSFDEIEFDKLPKSFVIKCNHGCKWQYIIKDKENFLNNSKLFSAVRQQMTGWLEQEFWCWGGFEMQYRTSRRPESPDSISGARVRLSEGKVNDRTESEVNCLPDTKRIIELIGEINEPGYNDKYGLKKGCQEKGIEPKILIEPLLRDNIDKNSITFNLYCFNGNIKILVKFYDNKINIWDENLNPLDNIFNFSEENIKTKIDDLINQSFVLSKQLSQDFCFVRVDWMIYNNKLFFEELTFTPYSGFNIIEKTWNKKMGEFIQWILL